MARFYASMQGSRGEATRCGTTTSGLSAHIRGWDVGIKVEIADDNGRDVVEVYRTAGSNGAGHRVLLGRFFTDHHEIVPELEWSAKVYS